MVVSEKRLQSVQFQVGSEVDTHFRFFRPTRKHNQVECNTKEMYPYDRKIPLTSLQTWNCTDCNCCPFCYKGSWPWGHDQLRHSMTFDKILVIIIELVWWRTRWMCESTIVRDRETHVFGASKRALSCHPIGQKHEQISIMYSINQSRGCFYPDIRCAQMLVLLCPSPCK